MQNKYVIVKGCAGLGNRLFTICSAIEYSIKTNRKLIVDWSDGLYGTPGDNIFTKYFHINNNNYIETDDISKYNELGDSVYPAAFKHNLHLNLYDLYQPISNSSFQRVPVNHYSFLKLNMLKGCWAVKQNVNGKEKKSVAAYLKTLLKKNAFPLGEFLQQNIKEDIVVFADYVPFLIEKNLNLITLKPFIEREIIQFAEANKLHDAIGVHIRNTDMKPSTEIECLILAIKKKHPNKKIFLSTDNNSILAIFKKRFEDVITHNKFAPELKNNEGLHQWASFNLKHDKAEQIFKDSIMDMYSLTKCEYFFYQENSSFSIIAKTLHNYKNKCCNWLKLNCK